MTDDRRARAEGLVTPLGRTMGIRLRLTDGDIREELVEYLVERPYEGLGDAVRAYVRKGIQKDKADRALRRNLDQENGVANSNLSARDDSAGPAAT